MGVITREQLWAASTLASSMSAAGLPANYKDRSDYKNAKFTGDVFGFVGDTINKGLIGLTQNCVIVAFAGTDGRDDWFNNFMANQTSFSNYGRGKVHIGFFGSVNSIYPRLLRTAIELAGEQKHFYLTGHSKGGAMAAITAMMFHKDLAAKITSMEVVTFGAPRVGDAEFKAGYAVKLTRYESNLDLVTHLPMTAQEQRLFPWLSSVIELLADYLKFPPYQSVGTRIGIDKPHGRYSGIPCDVSNSSGENLNAFCASCALLTARDFSMIGTVHTDDYK